MLMLMWIERDAALEQERQRLRKQWLEEQDVIKQQVRMHACVGAMIRVMRAMRFAWCVLF